MNLFTCVVDFADSGHGHAELARITIKLKSPTGVGDDYNMDEGDESRRFMLVVVTDRTGANPRAVVESFGDVPLRTDNEHLFWWP